MAAAYAAQRLGLPCTVVVYNPQSKAKLESLGAKVLVHGSFWDEADELAQKIIAESEEPKPFYIPPFENPILQLGHATIIDEMK